MKEYTEKLINTYGSNGAYFELYEINTVGIHNTPYHILEVRSTGTAKKHVIEIRLIRVNVDYNGEPVEHKFRDIYVSHGMRSESDKLAETKEYIDALTAALDAAFEIQKYCVLNGWWKA